MADAQLHRHHQPDEDAADHGERLLRLLHVGLRSEDGHVEDGHLEPHPRHARKKEQGMTFRAHQDGTVARCWSWVTKQERHEFVYIPVSPATSLSHFLPPFCSYRSVKESLSPLQYARLSILPISPK